MFSKNIQKRYQENNKYLSLKASFLRKFQREKEIFQPKKILSFLQMSTLQTTYSYSSWQRPHRNPLSKMLTDIY